MDISADLEELAHTPVMVVCAGAKSILDLGLTLEYLETHGVPVIGYGTERAARLLHPEVRLQGGLPRSTLPAELAKAFYVKQDMGLGGGMLVTNPIPEEYSMDRGRHQQGHRRGRGRGQPAQGIHGKETTPFLLAKIKDITGGDSLASNIQLVYNNARAGCQDRLRSWWHLPRTENSAKMDWSGISRPVLFSTASAKQGVSLPNHRKAGNER